MVLKGRRIKFNREEEQTERDVNADIDQVIGNQGARSPVVIPRDLGIDTNSFIGQAIMKKKDTVDQEKRQLNTVRESLQRHADELEALNYIASGEPQMAVVDVLEMVNDFKKDFGGNKPVEDAFIKMELTILESTIESFQGSRKQQS